MGSSILGKSSQGCSDRSCVEQRGGRRRCFDFTTKGRYSCQRHAIPLMLCPLPLRSLSHRGSECELMETDKLPGLTFS